MSLSPVFIYHSPIGDLRLQATDEALSMCDWAADVSDCAVSEGAVPVVIADTMRQLDEYFRGERREFTVPLSARGTAFREKVWRELQLVPYGQTISYGTLACRTGNPKASRAVAGACHNNPIAIIIPCHRIIGADGSMTGYAAGISRKEFLLELEGALPEKLF